MTLDVFSKDRKKVGTVEVPVGLFGARWNANLVRQVLDAYGANRRKPTAHVKGRGDVRGGGKKPYPQKHTGKSRQSSIRSPIWIGGGTTHGPSKDRNFVKKVNRRMRLAALAAVLTKKAKEGEVFVVDDLGLKEPKTKFAAAIVKAFFEKPAGVLFVPSSTNRSFSRAARNLPKTTTVEAREMNVYDAALRRYVLIERAAIDELAKIVTKQQ